jgi:hypothetical protein
MMNMDLSSSSEEIKARMCELTMQISISIVDKLVNCDKINAQYKEK